MQRVGLFWGSSGGENPIFSEQTLLLGQEMAARRLGLVYGGGHIGLMGVLADAVLRAGGEVIGVIPEALRNKELAHDGLTALHVVPSMHQRKALMAGLAGGFIALPGGFGAANELFQILTRAQLDLQIRPVG